MHWEFDEHSHEEQERLPAEDDPIWSAERIRLKSVGIDIGSSTSHLMFSNLELRRQGLALSSRYTVVKREVFYKSKILLTPYIDGTTIDVRALNDFITESYREAKVESHEIDTGAVITTGEAANKENAPRIIQLFSQEAGKFVCATAGHHLEALMAAYGSGAVDRALKEKGRGKTVLNIDLGGGTCKLSLIRDNGIVQETAAVNVGARLIAFDEHGCIDRIEEAGRLVGKEAGIDLKMGETLTLEEKTKIARLLKDCLFEVIENRRLSALSQRLMVTYPLSYSGPIDLILFSGGVSEYIYQYDNTDYGDLGTILAKEIRDHVGRPGFGIPIEEPLEGIRATVIGASQYTVQVSGNTILLTNRELLPMRNLQVVTLNFDNFHDHSYMEDHDHHHEDTSGHHFPHSSDEISPHLIETAIKDAYKRFGLEAGEKPVVLAMRWDHEPNYKNLRALSEGIYSTLLENGKNTDIPLIMVFSGDVGQLVGNILLREFDVKQDIISIDQIELRDFDFIDLGKEIPNVNAVPVVIKSLIFRLEKRPGV